MFSQTNVCIHVHSASPKCRRLFKRLVQFSQVFTVTTQSITKRGKKPLVSRVHPQTFVTMYVGSPVFSLTSSLGIFRGRGYPFTGYYFVGAVLYLNRLWRHFKSLIFSLTKSRTLKKGDNFSLRHILSFDSSSNGEGTHHIASHCHAGRETNVPPLWGSCLSLIHYLPFDNSAMCYFFP